jgi:hypothetical protein
VEKLVEKAEKQRRLDRVERLADVIVRGNAPDLEQGPGVVAPGVLLHVLLETQERGALGEEDGQGRGGDIRQIMEAVGPFAPVRQAGGKRAPALDKMIETAARVHGQKQCPYPAKSTSYNPVTSATKR